MPCCAGSTHAEGWAAVNFSGNASVSSQLCQYSSSGHGCCPIWPNCDKIFQAYLKTRVLRLVPLNSGLHLQCPGLAKAANLGSRPTWFYKGHPATHHRMVAGQQ
jgi:hypothetical protein